MILSAAPSHLSGYTQRHGRANSQSAMKAQHPKRLKKKKKVCPSAEVRILNQK